MPEKTTSMTDLLKIKEERFYNRFYKKIYQGRILKSTDFKYALQEYEKGVSFDITFSIGFNKNLEEFVRYLEENERLGHSIGRALRLRSSMNANEIERNNANIRMNEEKSTVGVVYFEQEPLDIAEHETNKWKKVRHFSELSADESVTAYAHWKAQKRFLIFLRRELAQLNPEAVTNTNSDIPDSDLPDISGIAPRNVQETISNLSIDEYKQLNKEIIQEMLTTKEEPPHPVLESKDSNLEHFTITQLAEFLRCSKPTIHNYKKAGLPYYRIGRKVLFEKKKVLEFMKTIKSR